MWDHFNKMFTTNTTIAIVLECENKSQNNVNYTY